MPVPSTLDRSGSGMGFSYTTPLRLHFWYTITFCVSVPVLSDRIYWICASDAYVCGVM